MIKNVEGLQDYTISYIDRGDGKPCHYSKAQLMYKGYKIILKSEFYHTLDLAVQGLKDRIKQAAIDFDLKMKNLE